MIHPDFTILYVDNTVASTAFYRGLLGIEPVEASETFALFVLPKGLKLGLWSRHHVQPQVTATGGSAELAFLAGNKAEVDMLFAEWQEKGLTMLQMPTEMDFGRTFTAADPDGHRLRVYAVAD